jgi:hypothetical protein
MKTLTIKDLARSDELGHADMAAVRGGVSMSTQSKQLYPMQSSYSPTVSPTFDSSLHATQDLTQFQQVLNETADGSAFLSGIHANNTTKQFGQNNIVVG